MKFSYRVYRKSFDIMLEKSWSKTNNRFMPDANTEYNFNDAEIFAKLSDVKKAVKEWIAEENLSETERFWLQDTLKETTLESLIDEELELSETLAKDLTDANSQLEAIKESN